MHRSQSGNAAVEMAVVLPGLLLLLMVLVETMSLMWVSAAMENALRSASRFGLTGWSPEGVDRQAAIMRMVAERTIGLVTERTATIDSRVYGTFGQIGLPEPYDDTLPRNGHYDPGESFIDVNGNGHWDADMGRDGFGGPGEVVVYTITYNAPFLTPLQRWIGGGGFTTLRASAVVRNEPWGGG